MGLQFCFHDGKREPGIVKKVNHHHLVVSDKLEEKRSSRFSFISSDFVSRISYFQADLFGPWEAGESGGGGVSSLP